MTAQIRAQRFGSAAVENADELRRCRHRPRHDGRGGRRTPGRPRPQGPDLARGTQRAKPSARAQAASMVSAARRGDRGERFHSVDPAAGRRARFGAALRAGAHREQQQAGVRRLQRGEPGHRRAHRRRHRADRLAVRRCRHHRLTTEAGRRRPALLRFRSAGAALCQAQGLRARRAGARGSVERGLGDEDVLCRHHQGDAGAGCRDAARRDARRNRRRLVGRIAGQPAADARLAQAQPVADAAESLSLDRGDARDRRFRRRRSVGARALCRRGAFLRADRARFRGATRKTFPRSKRF